MIALLARLFLKPNQRPEAALRKGYGILCGAVGVFLNVVLFVGKFAAGTLSGSIAITADAFNNLSDAGSSFISLLGFYLAGQKPDPHHPFGHGRMEYLSGLVISMLILLMGFELGKSSVQKILHPVPVDSSPLVLAILAVSIAVKLYMAFYNHALGRRLNAPAMRVTALDSLCDCVATSVVLLATLAGRATGLALDGWAGILVTVFILWSGIKAAKDTIDPLLGTPPAPEFVERIREIVLQHPGIVGIHDLIVHNYGPGRVMISLHAEVADDGDLLTTHEQIDHIEQELQETLGCHTVIHMDPVAVGDRRTDEVRSRIETLVRCIDESISIHDFRLVPEGDTVCVVFDAAVPFHFRLTDRQVEERIVTAIQALDNTCRVVVRVERPFT